MRTSTARLPGRNLTHRWRVDRDGLITIAQLPRAGSGRLAPWSLPLLRNCHTTLWLSDIDRPIELTDPDLASLRFLERQLPKRWLWPLLGCSEDNSAPVRGFTELALAHGIECAIDDPKRPFWRQRLSGLAPDLLISIGFSHIFKPVHLAMPRFGTVNLYPGNMPVYAGAFTFFHQLLDGRSRLGCTLHRIA